MIRLKTGYGIVVAVSGILLAIYLMMGGQLEQLRIWGIIVGAVLFSGLLVYVIASIGKSGKNKEAK